MNEEEIIKKHFKTINFKYVTLLDRLKLLFVKKKYGFEFDNHGSIYGFEYKRDAEETIYLFDVYRKSCRNQTYVIDGGRLVK